MAITWKKLAFDAETIKHSLATAANDFLVAPAAGSFVKKTLAETRAILGCVVQVQHAVVTSVVSGTTLMVDDDTIPQQTEGNEFITCSITPKSASNTLLIIAHLNASGYSSGYNGFAALFQDSTADALAAVHSIFAFSKTTTLIHKMAAGTTSQTTFKVRAGAVTAGTVYINVRIGANTRFGGGVESSTLTIFEYAQ